MLVREMAAHSNISTSLLDNLTLTEYEVSLELKNWNELRLTLEVSGLTFTFKSSFLNIELVLDTFKGELTIGR